MDIDSSQQRLPSLSWVGACHYRLKGPFLLPFTLFSLLGSRPPNERNAFDIEKNG
jgi:hypothetical protein